MKHTSLILVVIIILLGIGNFISSNEVKVADKDFTRGNYYKGYNSTEPPDYKRIYNEHNGSSYTGAQACNVDTVPISAGSYPYKPEGENGLFWFWAMSEADPTVMEGYEEQEDMYIFKVPHNTQLISIADSQLVSSSQYPIGLYPKDGYTKGLHITYITRLPEKKIAFKITYTSMEKWWVCENKTQPDDYHEGNKGLPKYYVGKTFTDDKEFYSGTVLGYSGLTGVPQAQREEDTTYLGVMIQKVGLTDKGQLDGEWTKASLSDLY